MLSKFFRPKSIVGTLPVTLTNGTTADATQVMSDLNWIVNQVNANAAPLNNPTFTGIINGASVVLSGTITGNAAMLSPITATLGGDVSLNNTGSYFDGPSVAQGTSGTWFASGTVTCLDSGLAAAFNVKLWDGTNVIASAQSVSVAAGSTIAISLSGYITAPAGNLRITVNDATAVTGKIKANSSGNSKDSTITAIRIG